MSLMARRTKLAELDIRETSGVDHPAHLHEGWLVIKSQDIPEEDTVELQVENESQPEAAAEIDVDSTPVAASVSVDDSLQKEISDLRKELMAMRDENARLEHERDVAAAVEKARGWSLIPGVDPAVLGPAMMEIEKAAPEAAQVIADVLSATAISLSEIDVLKEVGADASASGADAWSQIEARAQHLVTTGEAATFAKAVSLVAERDMDLYTTYISEKGL